MKNEPLCHAPCPIARSLGRIGDSWSIMILRDAFAGFTRFDEFQKSSNVAPNILSRRLKELVDDGLLEKVCYSSTRRATNTTSRRAAAISAWCCWRWRNGVTATSPPKGVRCSWWKWQPSATWSQSWWIKRLGRDYPG
jgi:DNA-binding HxlR family transcriptional regulator